MFLLIVAGCRAPEAPDPGLVRILLELEDDAPVSARAIGVTAPNIRGHLVSAGPVSVAVSDADGVLVSGHLPDPFVAIHETRVLGKRSAQRERSSAASVFVDVPMPRHPHVTVDVDVRGPDGRHRARSLEVDLAPLSGAAGALSPRGRVGMHRAALDLQSGCADLPAGAEWPPNDVFIRRAVQPDGAQAWESWLAANPWYGQGYGVGGRPTSEDFRIAWVPGQEGTLTDPDAFSPAEFCSFADDATNASMGNSWFASASMTIYAYMVKPLRFDTLARNNGVLQLIDTKMAEADAEPEADVVALGAPTTEYHAYSYLFTRKVVIFSGERERRNALVHELGHALGGLADEYPYGASNCRFKTSANVSEPGAPRWSCLIAAGQRCPAGEPMGAFPGLADCPEHIRPCANSVLGFSDSFDDFDEVATRIMTAARSDFDAVTAADAANDYSWWLGNCGCTPGCQVDCGIDGCGNRCDSCPDRFACILEGADWACREGCQAGEAVCRDVLDKEVCAGDYAYLQVCGPTSAQRCRCVPAGLGESYRGCGSCDDLGVELDADWPEPVCGNGAIEFPETCDPGADVEEGCTSCQVVVGWQCEGEPSRCEEAACTLWRCSPAGDCATQPLTVGQLSCRIQDDVPTLVECQEDGSLLEVRGFATEGECWAELAP